VTGRISTEAARETLRKGGAVMTLTSQRFLAALVDGGGTVPVELGVVRRLVERGHQVTVLGENTMEQEVVVTGASFLPWLRAPNRASRLPADDPYRDWECKNPLQLLHRLIDRQLIGPAPAYAADVAEVLGRLAPNAVICSAFAMGAMVAAESARLPFAVLVPNPYILPVDGMPPFGAGLKPARNQVQRTVYLAMTALSTRAIDRGLSGLNTLRVDYGLVGLNHVWEQIHQADRELVLTSQAFDFPARLPPNVRYVGPVLDDPVWTESWTPPRGDEPLVLVAMSSTFQEQDQTIRRVVEALARLPVRGLVTLGPALDESAITPSPNITVVASAPHNQVLRRARLVVTHGGHGTVMKSLAADVPLLVLPHGRDQGDNGVRVSMRKAGLVLPRTASSTRIARSVDRLLRDPQFLVGARRLGAIIRADAQADTLVTELESLSRAS
jgi:MGT family glycosyltransferase